MSTVAYNLIISDTHRISHYWLLLFLLVTCRSVWSSRVELEEVDQLVDPRELEAVRSHEVLGDHRAKRQAIAGKDALFKTPWINADQCCSKSWH